MERGLREPPLAQPRFPFVREQSITKEPAAVADYAVLEEILVVADQHGLDQVGVIQKIHMQPRSAVIKDIAVLRRPFSERAQRIGTGEWHVADWKLRLGSRRAQHKERLRLV